MDTLTHGLLGLALAALPMPKRLGDAGAKPLRAAIVVSVLAAELPDLDYLLPARDAVLQTLSAHRGLSHSLAAAPVVALAAALLTKAWCRSTAFALLYVRALLAVPLAHLLPDLWTGWGTRLLLPFSEQRLALDWTMVLDPWFTLPLASAALWAAFQRVRFRRAMALGAVLSAVYLGARLALLASLTPMVASAYPSASSVHVFPAPFTLTRWRFVARTGEEYAVGSVGPAAGAVELGRHRAQPDAPLPEALRHVPTVREALAWARFPVVKRVTLDANAERVSIADLRYHLAGQPTLTFVLDVERGGRVRSARLERGGSPRDLLRRVLGKS